MPEREAPRLLRRPDEVGGDHGVQRRQRLVLSHVGRRGGDREIERVAGLRRALHERLRRNRKRGDLGRERRDDGARYARGPHCRPRTGRRRPSTRQGLEVEWIAPALTEKHGPRRCADRRPQEAVDRLAGEAAELDHLALAPPCGGVQRVLERGRGPCARSA